MSPAFHRQCCAGLSLLFIVLVLVSCAGPEDGNGQLRELIEQPRTTEIRLPDKGITHIPSAIAGCESLSFLELPFNELNSIPQELFLLPRLRILNLAGNNLRQIPSEIKNASALRSLSLGNNLLAELPGGLFRLSELEQLSLSANKLADLPSQIGLLQNLKSLSFGKNPLRCLPPELGKLTKLEMLWVDGVSFEDPVAVFAVLSRLPALKDLSMMRCQLTKLPEKIDGFKNLTVLDLENNELSELPGWVLQLDKLKKLDLGDNAFDEAAEKAITAECKRRGIDVSWE